MPLNQTSRRLSSLWASSAVIPYDESSRFVIMSDCHRGIGNWGDNFQKNQTLFFAALSHYEKEGYTYIELGDGDELWENRSLTEIIQTHSNSFWLMAKLYRENRLHMLYGNHDIQKKKSSFMGKNCSSYFCENSHRPQELFPGMTALEALILQDKKTKKRLLLIHGHQGDLFNDTLWKVSRFLVRYIWRPLELIALKDPTSTAKNHGRRSATEQKLMEWCSLHQQPLIAGHTHRPAFPKPGETPYFNCGSCIHPRCITAIEIFHAQISLVKWSVAPKEDLTLFVSREVLEGPIEIAKFQKKMN